MDGRVVEPRNGVRPRLAGLQIGDNCYAMTMAKRLKAIGNPRYQADGDPRTSGPGFGVTMHNDVLDVPLRWRKPRKVFVNSMSDLFHPRVTDEFIASVFAVMAVTPRHTYQVLTKRPKRMRSVLRDVGVRQLIEHHIDRLLHARPLEDADYWRWPLPNVWCGTSVEDQQRADERIPALLDTPAAVRFLSCEPLLGPVDLSPWTACVHDSASGGLAHDGAVWTCDQCGASWRDVADVGGPCWSSRIGWFRKDYDATTGLHWVIVGGESGPGARPMHPQWARGLRDQAIEAGVPFLFKQHGAWRWAREVNDFAYEQSLSETDRERYATRSVVGLAPDGTRVDARSTPPYPDGVEWMMNVGKHDAGRVLDGRTWDEFPEAVTANA